MDGSWTAERFQRLNAIADAALEIPVEARDAYLDEACGTDIWLRREVAALLTAHSDSHEFLAAPLLELLAKDMSLERVTPDLSGRRIGRYEVISRLGAGGIGEVWLANDAELPRKIAIKMLSPRLAGDAAHVRRFQQEARAASLLNHPNIITIYDIGKWEGVDFIAEEFVPGVTLRERLRAGQLHIAEALHIGAQVSAALAAAHDAGIVHRDIKPENIMIRPDGLVKVLDFGLARFIEHGSAAGNNDSLWRPGAVLGTVRYMSPEQARGLPLEARSDIFSVGAVLYEMLAGVPPFTGPTSTDVLAAILHQEPPPLRDAGVAIPLDLEAVVRRCLQKDVAARYPSSGKLRRDLRSIARGFAPVETPADELGGWAGLPLTNTQKQLARRNYQAWPIWAAVAGVALLSAGILFVERRSPPAPAFDKMTISRVATRGESSDAAISSDGKYVAYVLRAEAGESIWNTELESGSDVRVVAPEPGNHVGMKFSPNGAYLYYRLRSASGAHDLYRVPALGGMSVKILSDVPGSVALSPDGKRIALIRINPKQVEASLVVANADGSDAHTLRTKQHPQYYSRNGIAWAPDGGSIACFMGQATGFDTHAFHLVSVNASDGNEKPISSETWAWVDSIAWANPNVIAVNASSELQDRFQIWLLPVGRQSATRITNDLTNYRRITLSGDGKMLEALQTRREADVWVASAAAPERSARIGLHNVHGLNSLAWTSDDKIAFTASSGERRNIWIMDADGGNRRQISAGPADKQELTITRDGRYFLFSSRGAIWRMNLDGTNAMQLTHGSWSVHPASAADSRTVFYSSFRNWSPAIWGKPTLWQVPIDGGQPIEITGVAASVPQVSPDGKKIACSSYPGPTPESSASPLAVFSVTGGLQLKVFDSISLGDAPVAWTADGKAVVYRVRTHDVDNLWRQPLAGGPATPVTAFQSDDLFSYAFSPDFKKIAMGRGREATDVVLISGFK